MRTLFTLTTIVLFTCIATYSFSQQLQKELWPQQSIQATIASGETHRYTLKLSKAQFATITLMQKGVDVVVTTFDTQGPGE